MSDDPIIFKQKGELGPFEVGRLAFGCLRLAGKPLKEFHNRIITALDIGTNIIDTADVYGLGQTRFGDVEERLGAVFQQDQSLRERIVLVTKGGAQPPLPYISRKDYLVQACEASLRRLKTDRIDLYLIHRHDLLTAHTEAAEAITLLRKSGKVREVGVSNYSPSQMQALQGLLDFPLVTNQLEISPLVVKAFFDGTMDLAQTLNFSPMAWSPIAGGVLAINHGWHDKHQLNRVAQVLDNIAEKNACEHWIAALAWLLAHPTGIIPIIGSQNPERIIASAKAYQVKITRRDWYEVLSANAGKPMP